jgi:hypothetical protein
MILKKTSSILSLWALCWSPAYAIANPTEFQSTIEKEKDNFGNLVDVRYLHLSAPPILQQSPTIAQYHWIWKKLDVLPKEPLEIIMSCPIANTGKVGRFCKAKNEPYNSPLSSVAISVLSRSKPNFPMFESVSAAVANGPERRVSFPLILDPSTKPVIDITSGRIVHPSQIKFTKGGGNYYPARALRREIEGKLTMDCQVQVDFSIICNAVQFDPQEHFNLFEKVADTVSIYSKVSEKLSDGSSSSGARTRMILNFKIPK